jgi:hypothetical protein
MPTDASTRRAPCSGPDGGDGRLATPANHRRQELPEGVRSPGDWVSQAGGTLWHDVLVDHLTRAPRYRQPTELRDAATDRRMAVP